MTTGQYRESGSVIGVFNNHRGAMQLKEAIQSAGIPAQKVEIDSGISPLNQGLALGTTTGGQAGLLLGAGYGGVLGILFVLLVLIPFTGATPYSNISPLTLVAFTVVGAVLGLVMGKGLHASAPQENQIKGNPNAARNFRVVVKGSEDEVRRAHQTLQQQSVVQG